MFSCFGRRRGADGTAVDSGRRDADEEASVESGIASQSRAFASPFIQLRDDFCFRHDLIMPHIASAQD